MVLLRMIFACFCRKEVCLLSFLLRRFLTVPGIFGLHLALVKAMPASVSGMVGSYFKIALQYGSSAFINLCFFFHVACLKNSH